MQVDSNVSESDIGDLRIGQHAQFTVDAYGDREFDGTVAQVRQAPITVQNVVTYDVVVDVDNPELLLKPGMTANATIVTARRDDVIRVPMEALRFSPRRNGARNASAQGGAGSDAERSRRNRRIWVQDGSGIKPVKVTAGLDDGTNVELLSGDLKPGDLVVTDEIHPVAKTSSSAIGGSGRGGWATSRIEFERFCRWPRSSKFAISPRPTIWATFDVHALNGVNLTHRARRVRRGDGRVGLGQVDADEHARMPRPAHQRQLPARRRGRGSTRRDRAGGDSQPPNRVHLPDASTCWREPARARTWSCRCFIPPGPTTTASALPSCCGWSVSRGASRTCPTSYPAGSSSGSRSRARWSTSR